MLLYTLSIGKLNREIGFDPHFHFHEFVPSTGCGRGHYMRGFSIVLEFHLSAGTWNILFKLLCILFFRPTTLYPKWWTVENLIVLFFVDLLRCFNFGINFDISFTNPVINWKNSTRHQTDIRFIKLWENHVFFLILQKLSIDYQSTVKLVINIAFS